ncbi:MAG: type II secretion system protein [Patescibacteria group bacterium]|nr:type II secretion system protein [Patescibacteria group bacterium]
MSVFYLRIIKAYTFLEIIVVVGITGILAGTSVLSAGKFLDFIDKRNFERTFQQQLISLQTQALIRGEDIYIDFDTDELGETGKYFVSYFQSGSFVISDTLLSSSRFLVRTDFDISASTDAFVLHGVSDRDEVVTKDIVVSDTGSVLSFDDDLQTLTLSLIPESTSTEFQEYLRLFRYSSGHIDSPIYIDTLSVYDTVL